MRFGFLGTLEVVDDDGRAVELGGAQPRTLLAMLLVAGGRLVTAESVVDALWGDAPPVSAAGTLQSYVSRLRRVLEPGRARGGEAKVLVHEPPGYRLVADPDAVDATRFERLAAEGRSLLEAGRVDEAFALLTEAAALWRGPALLEFRDHAFASGVAARLEDCRLGALEDRFDAALRLGRHAAVVGELGEVVRQHPLREGLRAQHALALYRSGRQADALRALDDTRRTLRDELGIDPGHGIRELEARILDHDPSLLADPAPTPAAVPTAPAARPSPAPAAAADDAADPTASERLYGRQGELGQLLAAFAEATSSGARMAVVEGEPGIGKTRLVEELAAEAGARGATVAWGRSHEGGATPAFWPWLGALRLLVDLAPAEASAQLQQVLSPGDASASLAGPRYDLYEAVLAVLSSAAAARPVVVVLDDVQWADQASLDLLAFLAGALADEPVLVVATVRELEVGSTGPVVDALAALARRTSSRRMHLRGLGTSDLTDLLAAATASEVTPSVAAAIHTRAEGNPFYATELARLLAQRDALDDPAAVLAADIPAGVRDVIRQRCGRLPASTVELLQVAAVIGRDVELSLLTQAADRPVDECLDDLEHALVHRLLIDSPDRPATFRFTHALVREVLVEDLSSLRRARLHLRVADAIERVSAGADDAAEILADHLWSAAPVGVGRRAAAALERAAAVAVRRFAYESARDLLERAAQLWRTANNGTDDDLTAELRVIADLMSIQRALEGHQSLIDHPLMDRARDLARRSGHEVTLFRLLWSQWAGFDNACDFERSTPPAEEIRALAETSGDLALRGMARLAWGVHEWHFGRLPESSALLDEASAIVQETGAFRVSSGFDQDQDLMPQPFALYVHTLIGDLPDARARFDELAARAPDPYAQSVVQSFIGAAATCTGDFETAVVAGRKGLDVDPELAFGFWGCTNQLYLSCGLAMLGAIDEAVALFDAAMPRLIGVGARTGTPLLHARLAHGLARAGRLDEAQVRLDEAYRTLRAYVEAWAEPIVYAAEAELRLRRDAEVEAASALLRKGIDIATSQGALAVAAGVARIAEELTLNLD